MRIFLRGLSWYLLVLAGVIAVVWVWRTRRLEAFASLLVLLATVTLTFVDRWAARRERRRELLRGLVHELYMNLQVLASKEFAPPTPPALTPTVYPRLYVGALQAVIASGAFTETRDRRLTHLLHGWLQRAQEFNERLLVTEMWLFAHPTPEEIATWQTKLASGAVLQVTRERLGDLATHLMDHYARESGIDRNSVLFAPAEDDSPLTPPRTS
jgi:hypothetical protein